MSNLRKTARAATLSLFDAGTKHKRWTPEEKRAWNRAVNALQALSGHKIRVGK